MKRVLSVCVAVLFVALAGCSTLTDDLLYLDRFSRNVVIYADGRIFVDTTRTDFRFVVRDLQAKGAGNNMPVVIQVERSAKLDLFDHVLTTLRDAGYGNISVRAFTSRGELGPGQAVGPLPAVDPQPAFDAAPEDAAPVAEELPPALEAVPAAPEPIAEDPLPTEK